MNEGPAAMGLLRLFDGGRIWVVHSRYQVAPDKRFSLMLLSRHGRGARHSLLSLPGNLVAIRSLLCGELHWHSISLATAAQVIRRFEECLESGLFFLIERPRRMLPGGSKKPDAAPVPEPEAEEWVEMDMAPEPEAAPEAYAMPYDLAVAQADTLRNAAESGVPFCEECERA